LLVLLTFGLLDALKALWAVEAVKVEWGTIAC